MKHSPRLFAFLGPSLLILAACSATPSGGGAGAGTTKPEDATAQTCSGLTDCPSIPCACARGLIDARRCINNYCLNAAATCTNVCGTSGSPDGGTDSGGDAGSGGGIITPPPVVSADPCVPVSTSEVQPRAELTASRATQHMLPPPTPSNGTVDVQRGDGDRVTRISYDVSGASEDYTDNFSYDSAGALTRWEHDAYSVGDDVTENFAYDSSGRLTRWEHDAYSVGDDVTENFSYDSSGRLTHWEHDAYSVGDDVTENFGYDSSGRLTRWEHDAYSVGDDVIERFSFDSAGRLTRWEYDAYSSSYDASITVSYSGSSSSVSANGSKATGATVSKCP